VLLNDELDDFTALDLGALFDLAPGPNAPRGGARPVSSMTPTIVFKDGAPVLALGGSGGFRIAENVTQALLNRLAFDRTAHDAVSAPRFFAPARVPGLTYGADELPPAAVQIDLAERGEQIRTVAEDTSAVQMVAWNRQGGTVRLEAAADPRKGGMGLVK
jgi:gamma-glutamyltranspeptidase/glutathione hydrolase